MTKRRPISQLPSIHRTAALERFFGSTVDHLFQPGRAEPLSGYIGRVPSYNDVAKDFYKQEPNPVRARFQLEAAMVSSQNVGSYEDILFYEDLIARLSGIGVIVDDPNRLFKSEYWSWAPPVDIDKINNFQQYYWSGSDVPALPLTLPGMELPTVHVAAGGIRRFAMGPSLPCMRVLEEDQILIEEEVQDYAPSVIVGGETTTEFVIDGEDIVLNTAPPLNTTVQIYRYGRVSDGVRTDYSIPEHFNPELPLDLSQDVHVYIRGRETFDFIVVDETRIRLNEPAPIDTLVTVTIYNSIEELCTGRETFNIEKLNTVGVQEMVNGLKVRLIDPSVYFLGFDIKPYDTFKWDERRPSIFYVDGVGISIYLTDATILAGLEPQYVVMSRADRALSYFSRINRWVTEEALAWFKGKTFSRQAKRPICEFVPNLQLWNYGKTRAPNTDCFFGVISDFTMQPFSTVPYFDDTGRAAATGDVVLFGDVGDPEYNNKFFIWPIIDSQTDPDTIELEFLADANEFDVVSYTASRDEYRFEGGMWILCQKPEQFPLFDLFDNDGYSLGDEGIYPNTDFAGSRIFCYKIGMGDSDSVLGFPVEHDTYGQLIFENYLYTERYQYRDGEMIGYYYYRVDEKFHNQWYKSPRLLPEQGSPNVVVPLNLQANPNFGTPEFISRNNWFGHFASIVEEQEGFVGKPYNKNNWSQTARDLSLGNQIVQSRAPLLKLMLIMGENGIDLPRAITFAEGEYVRLKLKIREKIRQGLNSATLTVNSNIPAELKSILGILAANKTADFAFFLSTVGDGQYFIPPTPATLGITPLYNPTIIEENGEFYIRGHDGSLTASTDNVTDMMLLEFERLIYESRFEKCPQPFEFSLLDEYELFSGKFRNADYSREEINALQQALFEDWVRINDVDYQTNVTYDESNPFTWNYGSLTDRDGQSIPGNWRGIYRYYFDTEMPNITPWEMLGFREEPEWWSSTYGRAPFARSNPMWDDIEAGYIADGPRQGFDPRFARSGIADYIPVDFAGNLLNPVEARIVENIPPIQFAKENWIFGDCGPVETLWRRSSSYQFAKAITMFLMRPAQFVEYYWDTDDRLLVHDDQWIDVITNDRASHSELFVHGEIVNEVPKISYGIQNWLVEHMIYGGRRPSILGTLVRGLDVRLGHKMAGFTTPDRMNVSSESFGIIPSEDVAIELYQSPSLSIDVYSGIIIEYLNSSRWRVIGYNPVDPYFTIRPVDRGGEKKALNSVDNDERIINPWTPNVYYKTGMYVSYKGGVYEAKTPHLSSQIFEQEFWEPETRGQSLEERLYQYTDWDGSIERVPYTTVMNSRQEVLDFIFAYQRDLEYRGFRFPSQSWLEAASKFINWSNVDWATGSFLTVSPGARILEYDTPHGFVLNLEDSQISSGVVSRSGHVIDSRLTVVDRFDDKLTLTATGEDDIYGAAMRKAEVEHVLIFSNRTVFGDIIYDPVFNVRQERLKISARRTTEWTGRYDAPGFIISDGKIVDNFDKSANDIRQMFDIELADNSVLRDHARHIIGFEKRQYLTNLLLNDTQQFELYQGMIQQKGALGALDKIMRSRAVEGNRDIQYLEEWAFKIAEFGAYEPRGFVELNINQDDLNRQNQIIRLDTPIVNPWRQETPYEVGNYIISNGIIYVCRTPHVSVDFSQDLQKAFWTIDLTQQATAQNAILSIPDTDHRWVSDAQKFEELILDAGRSMTARPGSVFVDQWEEGTSYELDAFVRNNGFTYVANKQTTADSFDLSEWDIVLDTDIGFKGLPDAGYVRLEEATFYAPTFEIFRLYAEEHIRSGNQFLPRDSVWIYGRDHLGWGIEYLDYPSNSITAGNLLYEDFASDIWTANDPIVAEEFSEFQYADRDTPVVFKNSPRFVAFTDGEAGIPASAFTTVSVIPNEFYSVLLRAYVTNGFNGRISIVTYWLTEDGTEIDSDEITIDYVTNPALSGSEQSISEAFVTPSEAVSAIIQIKVDYSDNEPEGRVYLADPRMFYSGVGTTVTSVVTSEVNSDVIGTRFNLSLPHNFSQGDLVLIGGPILSSFEATGIFEIASVGEDWFEIDAIREAVSYDFEAEEEIGPSIYALKRGRFANLQAAQNAIRGELAYVDDIGTGRWAVYRAPNFDIPVRSQPDIIDNSRIASALVYDKQTVIGNSTLRPEPITLPRINPVDITLGLIVGAADREIDYKLEYDPAGYDDNEGRWTEDYIGRVWWDTSTAWFINPYTDILDIENPDLYLKELRYRSQNWSRLAPGSEIVLYEWTKSIISPELFEGQRHPDGQFVVSSEYSVEFGREIDVYYFWVKNPREVPKVDFRNLDCQSCANIIANPSLSGVPWIALVSDRDFVVSGLQEYLNDKSTVLQIQLQLIDWDEEVPHTQWQLMRQGDRRAKAPVHLLRKMRDTLVGFDDNLALIPSPTLHPENRIGIGKGQSMIDESKRRLARESFITMLNYQLARRNFGSDQNFGDDRLDFATPIPEVLSWTRKIGETNLLTIPPRAFYDEVTTDPARLTEVLADTSLETYTILLDNRFSENPGWSVWQKRDNELLLANAYDIAVETRNERDALTAVENGIRVLIREDREFENLWTISRKTEDGWVVEWAQTYRTRDFWQRADWFAEGFDANNPPVVTYPSLLARNQAESPVINTLVRVLDNGAGYWIWTQYRDGAWEVVAQQLGTFEFSDLFYRNNNSYGLYTENEFVGSDVRLRDGSHELRILFDVIFGSNAVLSDLEQNELWFSMINFIHAHHDTVDWAFKTSFLSIVGFNELITAAPTTSPDRSNDILKYVEEVKPYRVTIRDFSRSLTPQTELVAMVVTDFDQPMYFDIDRQQYRRLDQRIPADRAIMEQGVWRHSLSHPDQVRKFRTTIVFDRIWFEDTPDSGAYRRIVTYYQPRPDMLPKNLRQLLDLDFKGTILDGTDFELGVDLEETKTTKRINGEDTDERGYQMRDPRVAENTPQELVRLGGHDVFLCRAKDKWGAGAPLGTVNHYDVSGETADSIDLRIDALARDVVVFVDGLRLPKTEYIFNQLGNLVQDIPLVINNNRVKSIIIHAFGYAAHQTIIDQQLHVATDEMSVFDIPQDVLEQEFSFEATINGNVSTSQRVGSSINVPSTADDQIVLTYYKTDQVDSTYMAMEEFGLEDNVFTVDKINTGSSLGAITNIERWFVDFHKRRQFVGGNNGSLLIKNLDTEANIVNIGNSNFVIKAILEGSDLFVTQDNSTATVGNPRFRAIGIRDLNVPNAPLVLIGTNGEYASSASMQGNQIPEDVDIVDLSNPYSDRRLLLIARQGQSRIYNVSGELLLESGDIGWGQGSFLVKTAVKVDSLEGIIINPASTTKPFVRISIPSNGDIEVEDYEIDGLSALGAVTVTASCYDQSDDSLFLWVRRTSDSAQGVVKYSLQFGNIVWVTWYNDQGVSPFELPSGMNSTRLSNDARHIVWASSLGAHNLNPRTGEITLIDLGIIPTTQLTGVSNGDRQFWDEVNRMLVVARSSANNIQRYTAEFSDAPTQASFSLSEVSLVRPLISSMIVEVDGRRLSPPRMFHISRITEYPVGDAYDPTLLRVRDDTGVVQPLTVYGDDDFANLDDVSTSATGRYAFWRNILVLRDRDANTRAYTVFVEGTGEFTIAEDTNSVVIKELRFGEVVTVQYWRNDAIMQPLTWSFRPRETGIYRINTKSRPKTSWVTRGGYRLVEGIDYDIIPTTLGAWDLESYDTFRYDSRVEIDIVIKNTVRAYENDDIVITTFEGIQATPALEWQIGTTTPSVYRFEEREADDTGRNLIREPRAWEITTHDIKREGGALLDYIPKSQTILEISISENPLSAPQIIQAENPIAIPEPTINNPGVVWIGPERLEYFKMERADGIIKFTQIRRGTRGTPTVAHPIGEYVTVQNPKRTLPPLPQPDLELPLLRSNPLEPVEEENNEE